MSGHLPVEYCLGGILDRILWIGIIQVVIFWVVIILGGNFPDGNCPCGSYLSGNILDGNCPRWELSCVGIFWVGVILGGNFLGWNCPGWDFLDANCPGASYPGWIFSQVGIFQVRIFRSESAEWQFSRWEFYQYQKFSHCSRIIFFKFEDLKLYKLN